jgi:hypothetical protein
MSHQSRRETDVRRRNGKLQSCEPCRKGKLRCDHMMPTCGRCARLNKADKCTYHPAPLTRTYSPSSPQNTALDTSEANDNGSTIITSHETNTTFSSLSLPLFSETPIPRPRVQRASSLPAQPWSSINDNHQCLGDGRHVPDNMLVGDSTKFAQEASFISHLAIIAENELSIGIMPPSYDTAPTSKIPQTHVDRGVLVLAMLKDLPLFEKYIDKWFSFSRGVIIIEPMVKIWITSLWSSWRKTLEASKADGLRQMSEKVWANTMNPLSRLLKRHTTPREFIAATTGDDIRWEVVGIIFTLVGLLSQSLQDGDPIFCSHDEPPVDRRALALKCFQVSDTVETFCNDFDIINDLSLWLLYENTVLDCSLHRKGSFYNWRKAGILASSLTAFGLHKEIKVDDHTPFFIAEFRKRLFVSVYENDKYSSAFAGRPPRLTRQYCLLQLPYDLNDAQIMSDGPELEAALAGLDHSGWNQQGSIQRCTFARIFASDAMISEDILEISLGIDLSSEEVVQRAADIEVRANQVWENYPPFLRLDEKHPWDVKRAPIELIYLIWIRLDHLGHKFLLQRTLIKKVGAHSTKLLAIAQEIFDYILYSVNNRDILRDFQMDMIQFMCMYGIPASAVVAVEFLHQVCFSGTRTTAC